jgi:isoleucyl-tRNA synthetase
MDAQESVHLARYPTPDRALIEQDLEQAVLRMQQVILLGRQRREDVRIGLRTPLRRLTIVNRDASLLRDLQALEAYLRAELNVLEVHYDTNESAYIETVARPNFALLGKRLGKRMKAFQARISALGRAELETLQATGVLELDGEQFSTQEIEVLQKARPGTGTVSNRLIAVDLDTTLDEALIRSGHAREIVNRIQRLRKESGFNVTDRVRVTYAGAEELRAAAEEHAEYIQGETLAIELLYVADLDAPVEGGIDDKAFHCRVVRA